MSFKVGDKVRYIGGAYHSRYGNLVGLTLEVSRVGQEALWFHGQSGGWNHRFFALVSDAEAHHANPPRAGHLTVEQAQANAQAAQEALAAAKHREEVIQAAQAVAAEEKARVEALRERLADDAELALQTGILLQQLRQLLTVPGSAASRIPAKFRTQLQPLARSYGAKLVLIGDRSTCTLVKL